MVRRILVAPTRDSEHINSGCSSSINAPDLTMHSANLVRDSTQVGLQKDSEAVSHKQNLGLLRPKDLVSSEEAIKLEGSMFTPQEVDQYNTVSESSEPRTLPLDDLSIQEREVREQTVSTLESSNKSLQDNFRALVSTNNGKADGSENTNCEDSNYEGNEGITRNRIPEVGAYAIKHGWMPEKTNLFCHWIHEKFAPNYKEWNDEEWKDFWFWCNNPVQEDPTEASTGQIESGDLEITYTVSDEIIALAAESALNRSQEEQSADAIAGIEDAIMADSSLPTCGGAIADSPLHTINNLPGKYKPIFYCSLLTVFL